MKVPNPNFNKEQSHKNNEQIDTWIASHSSNDFDQSQQTTETVKVSDSNNSMHVNANDTTGSEPNKKLCRTQLGMPFLSGSQNNGRQISFDECYSQRTSITKTFDKNYFLEPVLNYSETLIPDLRKRTCNKNEEKEPMRPSINRSPENDQSKSSTKSTSEPNCPIQKGTTSYMPSSFTMKTGNKKNENINSDHPDTAVDAVGDNSERNKATQDGNAQEEINIVSTSRCTQSVGTQIGFSSTSALLGLSQRISSVASKEMQTQTVTPAYSDAACSPIILSNEEIKLFENIHSDLIHVSKEDIGNCCRDENEDFLGYNLRSRLILDKNEP